MADETRAISNRQQLFICLRWVSEKYEVFEDMIGLVQLKNTIAECVYISLKDCVLRFSISFEKCRGQAYDGASNFQAHVNGVGKRFLNDNSTAIPVHCLAHCVNYKRLLAVASVL